MRQCLVCGNPFSIESGRGRPPQTCSQTCRNKRKRELNDQARERAVARGCPPDKHGTATGYTEYKCPCGKCRKWARNYQQSRRTGTPIDPIGEAPAHAVQ